MHQTTVARLERFVRAMDVPMAILSVLLAAVMLLELLGELPPPLDQYAVTFSIVVWSLFLIEFTVRFVLAPHRRAFVSANWFAILTLALPFLRVLRLATLAEVGRGFQGLQFLTWLHRSSAAFRTIDRRNHVGYLLTLSTAVALTAALLVWWLEAGNPESPVNTFGSALWWSATMVTTINIDADPVSVPGRLISLVLRIYGMGVFVYLVSTVTTAWFGTPTDTVVTHSPAEAGDEEKP